MDLEAVELQELIDRALHEDVGSGDWTTLWTVPEGTQSRAKIVAKEDGILAGGEVARSVFARVDPAVDFVMVAADGDRVQDGDVVARIAGSARSILVAERLALNFLQRLSGIATLTGRFVSAVEGTETRILDTRKTTPGLRRLERGAVRAGGGTNHRFGLDDMVLIKENHIRAAGGIEAAIAAVRERNRLGLKVEIETTTISEVREAVRSGVDRILLDNMDLRELEAAVLHVRDAAPAIETEASGGVNLRTVREIAGTGVNYVSVGALTHSAPAFDLSLLIDRDDNL